MPCSPMNRSNKKNFAQARILSKNSHQNSVKYRFTQIENKQQSKSGGSVGMREPSNEYRKMLFLLSLFSLLTIEIKTDLVINQKSWMQSRSC